ncbi:MAG: helix-turn-helix domain-containing protein [Pirellulales bacterium]|nr:helix-turn-helix domain-containing protein [Pirellulales bacterium]
MVAANDTSLLLLNAAQAAERFGCSVRTWRSWDRAGQTPPPVRIGRSLYWRPKELAAWVEAGCPNRATWIAQRDD